MSKTQQDDSGEGGVGGHPPRKQSCRAKKTPDNYADYILPGRSEPAAASPVTQCPLLGKANGQNEFVPWSHQDMEALEKGLTHGSCSLKPTTANKLALGDVRALIVHLEGTVNLKALEGRTGTTDLDDEDPLDGIRAVFWEAMRTVWPTKTSMTVLATLKMRPGEEMFQCVRRAETEWRLATGERHNKSTAVIWRRTVQQGFPQAVQAALEGVVELDLMDEITRKDHLTHFYKIYRAAEKKEVEKMTQWLLKGSTGRCRC